ncbi:MAG: hypothetical protein RSE00_02190 [Clostridia bacterium]
MDINCDCNCKNAGFEFIALSTVATIVLSCDLTISEMDLLGNFLQSIGQNLATIVAANSNCIAICEKENCSKKTG